ncbi:hypothetical protein [Cupriavidus basilensis]
MIDQSNAQIELLTANCEAGLRALTLILESQQRLLKVQLDAIRNDIETSHEIGTKIKDGDNFAAFSALPVTLFRNQAEHCAKLLQASMMLAHSQPDHLGRSDARSSQIVAATLGYSLATGRGHPPVPKQDIYEKLSEAAA